MDRTSGGGRSYYPTAPAPVATSRTDGDGRMPYSPAPPPVQPSRLNGAGRSYYQTPSGPDWSQATPTASANGATPKTPSRPDWSQVTPTASANGATPMPTAAPMTAPGYYENYYSQHGNDLMNTPSASEQLYAEGMAGSNPYYDYAEQRATDSVNAAERARGGFNSGAALAEIGNSSAYLRGEQAHELGQLAGQADNARQGRYGLTGQMADTAQNHRENRIQTGFQDELALDTAQANPVQGFYSTAGNENQQAQMAAIEAAMKASGMDAAEMKQYWDMFTGGAGIAGKAAAA